MTPNFTIRLAKKSDARTWNNYVERHPHSGPYHLWEWKEAVTKAYNHRCYYLIAEETKSRKPVGILPLSYIKPLFIKGELVSLPFCDYGGPLADNEEIATALCKKARDKAVSLKAILEIRCNQPLSRVCDLEPFGDKVRMLLDLPEGSEILFKQFKSKLRSQIRRPIKDGLYSKLGGLELVQDFYNVFRINMRDLGSPVHSPKWFEDLTTF